MEHVHESPWVMLVPLVVLAVGAVVRRHGLAYDWFVGEEHGGRSGRRVPARAAGHDSAARRRTMCRAGSSCLPLVVGVAGIALA